MTEKRQMWTPACSFKLLSKFWVNYYKLASWIILYKLRQRLFIDTPFNIFQSRSSWLTLFRKPFKLEKTGRINILPWRFKKVGWVWYGGARETRQPRVIIGWLLPKENIFSIFSAFQDLNGYFEVLSQFVNQLLYDAHLFLYVKYL